MYNYKSEARTRVCSKELIRTFVNSNTTHIPIYIVCTSMYICIELRMLYELCMCAAQKLAVKQTLFDVKQCVKRVITALFFLIMF